MAQRASGWYDDPDDPTQLRYFDGILWTSHRTPKALPQPPQQEPAPAQDTPPSSPANPWQPPSSDQQPPGRQSSGSQPPSYGESPSYGQPPSYGQQPPAQGPWGQQPPGAQAPWQGSPTQQPGSPAPWGQQQGPWQQRGPYPLLAGPQTPDGQPLSGWWRRFTAYIIDWCLITAFAAFVSWPWSSSWFSSLGDFVNESMEAAERGDSAPQRPSELSSLPWQWALATLVVYAIYETVLVSWRGQTLGKLITGISVRTIEHRRPPELGESATRFVVKGISTILAPIPLLGGLASIFSLVDGLWPLGDARKQALHDKLPGTVVVRGRVRRETPLQ